MSVLKEIRKKQGMRLVDLAKKSGISIGWIWNLEQGYNKGVSKEIKSRIAKALDSPFEKVFPKEDK